MNHFAKEMHQGEPSQQRLLADDYLQLAACQSCKVKAMLHNRNIMGIAL